MEGVLASLARNICTVYLDDILVMGGTFEEYLHACLIVYKVLVFV